MRKLIIYGTGLIAEVVEYYFRTDTGYAVAAFTNSAEFIKEPSFMGRPVLPFNDVEQQLPPADHDMFVALGYAKTNKIRQQRYEEALQKGYQCATYLSSRACRFTEVIGSNCFILENNVIQPFVRIGNNVTLWSGNHIGHHSTIEDHCFISSQVVVSGNCTIGRNSFLGVNSTLRDNVKLGPYVVVGPGSVVMKDCEERTVTRPAESEYRIIKRDVL